MATIYRRAASLLPASRMLPLHPVLCHLHFHPLISASQVRVLVNPKHKELIHNK
jgi:hypothetical protein